MSQMISVASGFQYSVNIGYDLNNNDKLKNFIPTQSAIELLEEILSSTSASSTERARVLIGAYGKGKSHIVLMILSILMKRDSALLEKLMPKINENPRLQQLIDNYYESQEKILPVVITGSNTSLTQSFLIALQRTLSENNMLDVMPETNYKAAVSVIERWKTDFPDTFNKLEEALDVPMAQFIKDLSDYNIAAYEQFERLYPSLTAGSIFNPFLGFDVVDLYEQAARGIKAKGYTGIFVVYDEFSKFLEANINEASVSDTKMLQDFAEKSNRSGALQLHLMLICHKEISNYIDKLPKQKVDGWRGVSERFKHIRITNNYAQTYEIISSVIKKEEETWDDFKVNHSGDFDSLIQRYNAHPIFANVSDPINTIVFGCYPLAPISTFILPRLSEKVAQNERTLFTFLSADGNSTLPAFLDKYDDDIFSTITPDCLYDYFSPLLKKEPYGSEIYDLHILTENILHKLTDNELGSKLVKTISLIYILEQYECIEPTREELIGIFTPSYSVEAIDSAITELINKEFVIYLKRSNNFLKLKQSSGIDINQRISDLITTQSGTVSLKESLNQSNLDNYMYPARYNDERDITRYFAFEFIDESEITNDVDWSNKVSTINADGVIYGVICRSEESIPNIMNTLINGASKSQCIFVVPKHYIEIENTVREYNAALALREMASDDQVLVEEYDVIIDDLRELIDSFIESYTNPDKYKSSYIHLGKKLKIHRKAALTELMSTICDEVYSDTPTINNEAVNKNDITSIAANSRNKVIAALLRNDLEAGLGLSGSGQEVSIMRSTLIRTGIWEEGSSPKINLQPENPQIANLLKTIESFIIHARTESSTSFAELYSQLILPEGHIGLRKGLIPIYLAVVIHEYKKQIVITDRFGQVQTNLDTLIQINANPDAYSLSYLEWDSEKEEYIEKLANIFDANIIEVEKGTNYYDYVANAMKRWFFALPKYSKEAKHLPDGHKIDKRYTAMTRLLRQNPTCYELIFVKLPEAFGYAESSNPGIAENIKLAKEFYDGLLGKLKIFLINKVKRMFSFYNTENILEKMSLASVITDWCESIDQRAFEQLFSDGTDKCLMLFRNVTNDEDTFISRLAKLATGLRVEDWDSNTVDNFITQLEQYKKTASEFVSKQSVDDIKEISSYQISYLNESGVTETKRFDKIEYSNRGKLLYNQIIASLEAMGHSISEQEKRQVLIEVLRKLC